MNQMEKRIAQLNLLPHPEGGFYRETYRSQGMLPAENLVEGFTGSRNYSTAIYYLLPAGAFSAFHQIKSDEVWHLYEGGPLHVYVLEPNGSLNVIRLGLDADNGEAPQAVVPAGCWFASRLAGSGEYALAGCTVAPGFDFADFTLANRNELVSQYPQYAQLITELTRDVSDSL
jgi:uncharacterized protein